MSETAKPVDYFGERIGELPLPVVEPVSNEPTEFRRQHGKVKRLGDQIVDAQGNIGDPWRGLTLLGEWERVGKITKETRAAGDEFHRLFHLACLDGLFAADMSRVGGSPAPMKHRGHDGARDKVHAALGALGGPQSLLGNGAWLVLGCEYSIRQWAARWRMRGKPLDDHAAARRLRDALGLLAGHFGY